MNYTDEILLIDSYLKKNLTIKRYNHSLEVAKMSEYIAEKMGVSTNKAYLSGLSHDICREKPLEFLKKEIIDYSSFSNEFYKVIALYHGPVGAKLLKDKFGIKDSSICDAVKFHSIGSKNIDTLGKIVYVADYISLDRKNISQSFRSEVLASSLNNMVLKVVDAYRGYLESKGDSLLPETESMYNSINKEIE